ncbi:13552_t:CDS:2 [Entrophospora sp. SA101]|nr:13552_t:CDS:2 [Entrophospora sp. SA101]
MHTTSNIIDDDDYETYNDVEDDTIDDNNNDVNVIDTEDEDNTKTDEQIDSNNFDSINVNPPKLRSTLIKK